MPRLAIAFLAALSTGTDCCPCCPEDFAELELSVVDAKTGCAIPCFFVIETATSGAGPQAPPSPTCIDADAGACAAPRGVLLYTSRGAHTWLVAADGYLTSAVAFSDDRCAGSSMRTVRLRPIQ